MNKPEAIAAMEARAKVEGGKPDTDDYDTGRIIEVPRGAVQTAIVAWDSGVQTETPLTDLRLA